MTRKAQDIIDDFRNIVKPRIAKMLLEANFEGCGEDDKAEFETEFEITLTLAEKALKERKTGKWIEIGYVGNDNYNFMCSECRYTDTHTKAEKVNYCWHCGAKMEGAAEK